MHEQPPQPYDAAKAWAGILRAFLINIQRVRSSLDTVKKYLNEEQIAQIEVKLAKADAIIQEYQDAPMNIEAVRVKKALFNAAGASVPLYDLDLTLRNISDYGKTKVPKLDQLLASLAS